LASSQTIVPVTAAEGFQLQSRPADSSDDEMEVEVESVELVEAEEAGAEASLPAASGGERHGGQQGGGQQRDGHRSGSTEATREGDRLEVRD